MCSSDLETELARDKPEDEQPNAGTASPSPYRRSATRAGTSLKNSRNSDPADEDLITEAEINRILEREEDSEIADTEEKCPIPSPRRRNHDRDRSPTKSPSPNKEVTFQNCPAPVEEKEILLEGGEGNMEPVGKSETPEQDSQMKIHHVINLPPRKIQFIQKRRRRRKTEDLSYQKSARLSQLMMAEYKTADHRQPCLQLRRATIDVTAGTDSKSGRARNSKLGFGVGTAGRNMRRRIEAWYQRRVKDPIMEQINSGEAVLLDGIHKLQKPFHFRCGCGPKWIRDRKSVV